MSDTNDSKSTDQAKAAAPKKKAATRKKASKKTSAKTASDAVEPGSVEPGAELVGELKAGMIELQKQNNVRMAAQEEKLAQLLKGLEDTFKRMQGDSQNRDQANTSIFEKVSESIVLSSEESRKEFEELERLQVKRLEAERRAYDHSVAKARWMAIPGAILGVIAVIYMFHTVNVMEDALTSMSKDMALMRTDMRTMTASVGDMSTQVASLPEISDKMNVMAGQMGQMTRDVNVLTHNVSPAMAGVRQMMPWGP